MPFWDVLSSLRPQTPARDRTTQAPAADRTVEEPLDQSHESHNTHPNSHAVHQQGPPPLMHPHNFGVPHLPAHIPQYSGYPPQYPYYVPPYPGYVPPYPGYVPQYPGYVPHPLDDTSQYRTAMHQHSSGVQLYPAMPRQHHAMPQQHHVNIPPQQLASNVPPHPASNVPEQPVHTEPQQGVGTLPQQSVNSFPQPPVATLPQLQAITPPEPRTNLLPQQPINTLPPQQASTLPQQPVSIVPSNPPRVPFSSIPKYQAKIASSEETISSYSQWAAAESDPKRRAKYLNVVQHEQTVLASHRANLADKIKRKELEDKRKMGIYPPVPVFPAQTPGTSHEMDPAPQALTERGRSSTLGQAPVGSRSRSPRPRASPPGPLRSRSPLRERRDVNTARRNPPRHQSHSKQQSHQHSSKKQDYQQAHQQNQQAHQHNQQRVRRPPSSRLAHRSPLATVNEESPVTSADEVSSNSISDMIIDDSQGSSGPSSTARSATMDIPNPTPNIRALDFRPLDSEEGIGFTSTPACGNRDMLRCQHKSILECIGHYRRRLSAYCETMDGQCVSLIPLSFPLAPLTVTIQRLWHLKDTRQLYNYGNFAIGCDEHRMYLPLHYIMKFEDFDEWKKYRDRSSKLEYSHLCHNKLCRNVQHGVVESQTLNLDRNGCASEARYARDANRFVPEFCDRHDPPCLMRAACVGSLTITTNEVAQLRAKAVHDFNSFEIGRWVHGGDTVGRHNDTRNLHVWEWDQRHSRFTRTRLPIPDDEYSDPDGKSIMMLCQRSLTKQLKRSLEKLEANKPILSSCWEDLELQVQNPTNGVDVNGDAQLLWKCQFCRLDTYKLLPDDKKVPSNLGELTKNIEKILYHVIMNHPEMPERYKALLLGAEFNENEHLRNRLEMFFEEQRWYSADTDELIAMLNRGEFHNDLDRVAKCA